MSELQLQNVIVGHNNMSCLSGHMHTSSHMTTADVNVMQNMTTTVHSKNIWKKSTFFRCSFKDTVQSDVLTLQTVHSEMRLSIGKYKLA